MSVSQQSGAVRDFLRVSRKSSPGSDSWREGAHDDAGLGTRRPAPSPELISASLALFGLNFAVFDGTGRCLHVSSSEGPTLGTIGEIAPEPCYRLVSRALMAPDSGSLKLSCHSASLASNRASFQLRTQVIRTSGAGARVYVVAIPVGPLAPDVPSLGLTAREQQVASLLIEGACSKEIGGALQISVHTVRRHTERIFEKLGVRSRAQLVAHVRRADSRPAMNP